jgi:hypothetical protein
MRITWMALGVAVALSNLPIVKSVQAETTTRTTLTQANADFSAQSRRPRPRVRIYRSFDERGVYPSYNPGPNAVRECTANLVQEFRPSGTVIVPRMNCYWRRG